MEFVMKRVALMLIALAFGMTACTWTDSKKTEESLPPIQIQTVEEAERLEKSLEKNPDNLREREALAKFYSSVVSSKPLLRARRYDNIRWLVEHHPDYPGLWTPEYSLDPEFDGSER